MELKKLVIIESVLLLILAIAVAVFDASLKLGKFHGLVFSLYLAYGSGLIFIINSIISAAYLFKKDKPNAKNYIATGLIIGVTGVIVAYFGGRLF